MVYLRRLLPRFFWHPAASMLAGAITLSAAAPLAAQTPGAAVQSAAPTRVATSSELAAQAAHDAAEAAKAAAEAAHATAQAVHELAGHVEDIEHTEPSVAPALNPWGYTLTLSGLNKAGNAKNLSLQSSLEVLGRWRAWRTRFWLNGAYGFSDPVGDAANAQRQVTATNGTVSVRGERYYLPFLSNYAQVELFSDLVASIPMRVSGELGLTLTWFEVERDDFTKSRLKTSVGIEGMRESLRQFYPVRVAGTRVRYIYGPSVTFDFLYSLTKNVYAKQLLQVLYDIRDNSDIRVTSQSTLAAAITDHVGLQTGLQIRHIGRPADVTRQKTDYEISFGLNFSF